MKALAGLRLLTASTLLAVVATTVLAGEGEAARRVPPRLFAFPVQPAAQPAPQAAAPVPAPAAAPALPPVAAPMAAAARNAPAPVVAPVPVASAMFPLPDSGIIPVLVGRSQIVKLPQAALRVAVSDPRIADYVMVAPTQLYVYGKAIGATNLMIWNKDEELRKVDISVDVDLVPLRKTYLELLPKETDIRVASVGGSLVLSGSVSDTIAAEHALNFAEAFARNLQRTLSGTAAAGADTSGGGGATGGSSVRVINTLRIRDPQQVMLEVRFAEVSRSAIKALGLGLDANGRSGDFSWGIMSRSALLGLAGGQAGLASLFFRDSGVSVNASGNKNLVRILAEPTIVAVSGEEGSFLAGGRVLLPAAQASAAGATPLFSFQERDFGVGLKFKPTVLDGGRISLKVSPEVTELDPNRLSLDRSGVPVNAPSFRVRKLSTTVQMREGQSLIIGGLLQDNFRDGAKQIPGLANLPILGPLFRSADYSSELTELLVVVTPRLIRATDEEPVLPTEMVTVPTDKQLFGEGKLEGAKP